MTDQIKKGIAHKKAEVGLLGLVRNKIAKIQERKVKQKEKNRLGQLEEVIKSFK